MVKLSDGYYWAQIDETAPFIVEKIGNHWSTCGSEDYFTDPLPVHFVVLGPVAPWSLTQTRSASPPVSVAPEVVEAPAGAR